MAEIELQGACCSGIFFVIGLIMIFDGTRKFLLMQKIKNTPTSKVRSAAVGLVELLGNVRLKEELLSPISRARCAYHLVKCEWYKSGKHGGWRTFYTLTKGNRFFLEDDTGRMLVDPAEAELALPADFTSTGHLSDKALFGLLPQTQLDKKVLDFIETDSAVKNAFNSYKGYQLRVSETYLAEGDQVYVLGNASPLEGSSSAVSHENLLIRKDPAEKILYISDTQESKVVENVRNSMLISFAIGFILSAITLFIMLDSLGV